MTWQDMQHVYSSISKKNWSHIWISYAPICTNTLMSGTKNSAHIRSSPSPIRLHSHAHTYAHVHKRTIYLFLIIVICDPNAKATFIPVKDSFFLPKSLFIYKIQTFVYQCPKIIVLIVVQILYICCCFCKIIEVSYDHVNIKKSN